MKRKIAKVIIGLSWLGMISALIFLLWTFPDVLIILFFVALIIGFIKVVNWAFDNL